MEAELGIVLREAAIFALPAAATDPLGTVVRQELESADAVLIGPGFDDPDETRGTLLAVAGARVSVMVLDAFAIGILPDVDRALLPPKLVLNVNLEEAAILLEREIDDDRVGDLLEIARRFDAVVHCYGVVVNPAGAAWQVSEGGPGLGTSGSGDVLAGAITGFAARGVPSPLARRCGGVGPTHARAIG